MSRKKRRNRGARGKQRHEEVSSQAAPASEQQQGPLPTTDEQRSLAGLKLPPIPGTKAAASPLHGAEPVTAAQQHEQLYTGTDSLQQAETSSVSRQAPQREPQQAPALPQAAIDASQQVSASLQTAGPAPPPTTTASKSSRASRRRARKKHGNKVMPEPQPAAPAPADPAVLTQPTPSAIIQQTSSSPPAVAQKRHELSHGSLLALGTWNAECLALNPTREAHIRQLQKLGHMADAITANQLDIVALQEVMCSGNGHDAVSQLVLLLNEREAACGRQGTEWRFIDHYDPAVKVRGWQEMSSFVYKHVCGISGRRIISATGSCLILSDHDQRKYVGPRLLLQRSPAYARFLIHEPSRPVSSGAAPAQAGPPENWYSVILMTLHVKAQEGKNMGGTARDLQALGKLVKAIRQPNNSTIAGSTPVVMLGDFNQDCSNSTVFERILVKGWVPLLPPHVPTNAKGDSQFDNIWVQTGGLLSSEQGVEGDSSAAQDHGLLEPELAHVSPKPPGVANDCHSNHCLVHSRLRLLKQVQLLGQAPADGDTAIFQPPCLSEAYKGSLKAKISQVVVPNYVQSAPRVYRSFMSFPCMGGTWHCCASFDEEQWEREQTQGV